MTIPLQDDAEELFRQVHPSWIQQGRPTSQAFRPTPKDAGKLSVDRSSLTTAAKSFERHTGELALAGVWAVTVGESKAVGVAAFSDPVAGNPAHAYLDFRPLTPGEAKKVGQLLNRAANNRGPLYREAPE